MRTTSFLLSAVLLASHAAAVDLTKIDRAIRKEPAYQTKTPKYCLLVFGPEAKTRVWLVLDGKTLYVDRNGNGDLTEAGEKVVGKRGGSVYESDVYTFPIGELHDGGRRHRNVTLTVTGLGAASETKTAAGNKPRALSFRIRMEAEVPGFHGLGEGGRVEQMAGSSDINGALQFADRPQGAPVLHFAGPWTIALYDRPTFRVNREMEMFLVLVTPGRGNGTYVASGHEGLIPPGVYPRAEIAFPAPKPGDPAVKINYEIKGRC